MQITVNTEAVEIPVSAGATQYLLMNAGSGPVYLDSTDEVNMATAIILWSGNSLRLANPILGERLYALCENEGGDLRVLAIS